ncbi:hypothetical protein PV08_09631 [Exophiala spinifera]|uniref:Autophagy-related protein 28 n=1 Tax=Exophiala spinifera TaxID=91928 RepID=A0A0D2BMF2_9EURO|nr:uncharacterized protein PV08_09631 [Exophiala spinifera]KIW12354.1 hypothetical protein PV08_09631 [Exophiala spinifera]
MQKSFIERIFPHPSTKSHQHFADDDLERPGSSRSPRPIVLQDSVAPSSRSRSRSRRGSSSASASASASASHYHVPSQALSSASLVRHNDPFLPVERAARNLERTLQDLLDVQSDGLAAGFGAGSGHESSSVGSPTPTPSVVTSSGPHTSRPRTMPIRQPKKKRLTLRDARRGLSRSLAEFTALKDHELKIIDGEVLARNDALREASDLESRRQLLDAQVRKIQNQAVAVDLRREAHQVEQEITELETRLLELRNRHRHLLDQVREHESSQDSELSSYTEALKLNENSIRHFLRLPPVAQGIGAGGVQGMYAFKPERRTLQMAQDQWTNDLDLLSARKADVARERQALDEGGKLWHEVSHRIREFEKDVRDRTKGLTRSRAALDAVEGDGGSTTVPVDDDTGISPIVENMYNLLDFLQDALAKAEIQGWKLLICAIGAEVAAFREARDALDPYVSSTRNGDLDRGMTGPPKGFEEEDGEHQDEPRRDLLGGDVDAHPNGRANASDLEARDRTQSPSEESNHSLEATLRHFGNGLDSKKEGADGGHQVLHTDNEGAVSGDDVVPGGGGGDAADNGGDSGKASSESRLQADAKVLLRGHTSESEDDEPGPEFLLSHS